MARWALPGCRTGGSWFLAAALVVVICIILAWPELKRGARWLAARLDAAVRLPDAAWWGAAALLALVLGLSRWPILGSCRVGGARSRVFHPARRLSAAHRVRHPALAASEGVDRAGVQSVRDPAVAGHRGRDGALAGVVGGENCAATTAPPVTRSRLAGSRASRRWSGGDVGGRAIECGRA